MGIGLTAIYDGRIDREERRLGEPLDLAREMLAASPGLLTKYLMAAPLMTYQRVAPVAAAHVCRIAALRSEDCGPCVRIGIGYARMAGLKESDLKAAQAGRYDDLPHDLSLAAYFGEAIALSLPEVVELGEAIEREWGRAARVELALAAATARIHPAMKRGLGMAQSCAILNLDD
ncbi:hypothetical protein [Minwuia sp.]|uniref:hypothetical protein n=1 Tax=Minwuia sp. TaxID=2493630 RepID=UPI003A900588